MNSIDYIYAHVYYWYGSMAAKGKHIEPKRLTDLAFGLSMSGWLLLLMEGGFHASKRFDFTIYYLLFCVSAMVGAGLANRVYSRNSRHVRVYEKYILPKDLKKVKRAILLSWTFLLLPFLLFGIYLLLRYANYIV
jgi:hypothetical protein